MIAAPDALVRNVPPHSREAERAVLGAISIDPEAIHEVATLVEARDFYVPGHAAVYQAALALTARNEPVDAVSLNDELLQRGGADHIGPEGSAVLLAELMDAVPTAANARFYAKRVRELAQQRDMIQAAARAQAMCFERRDTPALLGDCERIVLEVSQAKCASEPVHVSQAVAEQVSEAPKRWPTGFRDLDVTLSGGLYAEELVIVGARPSIGKTTFCNSIVRRMCRAGTRVGYFSLEVPRTRLVEALISAEAGVFNTAVRKGEYVDDEERERVRVARDVVHDLPLWIDDGSHHTCHDIAARTRKLVRQHDVEVVFLDYVQRLADAPGHRDKRSAVDEMSRVLKNLARDMGIPVVVAAQLSRKVEERASKRPVMSDLKESGGLEQDADTIILLNRPAYYDPKDPEKFESIADYEAYQTRAFAIVGKQRNGPTGDVVLTFEGKYSRFMERPTKEER